MSTRSKLRPLRAVCIACTLALAGGLGAVAASTGCAADLSYPDGGLRITTILAPDQNEFMTVSPVFERRCATLDCHGQEGRPLRIYSGRGLRMPNDAGLVPGSGDTTPAEITANYRAVIGLEPEEMSRVVAGEDTPRTLLILAKPLMLQAHKGGPALAPTNDPGETCITSWLLGTGVDKQACSDAIKGL